MTFWQSFAVLLALPSSLWAQLPVSPSAASSGLTGLAALTGAQAAVLPVEKAFVWSVETATASEWVLLARVAPGTYLYTEKLHFQSLDKKAKLAKAHLPPTERKEDAFFGAVNVLRGDARIVVPVTHRPQLHRSQLKISYQGCADIGVCYPPQELVLGVDVSASMRSFQPGSAAAKPMLVKDTVGRVTVKSLSELKTALANNKDRRVLLDFYADWCLPCKVMEKQTFATESVQAALANWLFVKVDVTANKVAEKAILAQYKVPAPPSLIFLDPKGQEYQGSRLLGPQPPASFIKHLQLVESL
jgi:thiol:disulfide interchange protein